MKTWVATLLFGLVSISFVNSASAGSSSVLDLKLKMPIPDVEVLPNGLEVIWFLDPKLPVVDVSLVVKSGFRDDLPGKSGTVELLSVLLDRGSNGLSAVEVGRRIEAMGASRFITGEDDHIIVGLHGLTEDVEKLTEYLGQITLNPDFPEKEFKREYERLLDRWNHLEDFGDLSAALVQRRVLAAGSSYGRGSILSLGELKNVQSKDVKDFHKKHFRPRNSLLVVTGRADRVALKQKLLSVFGQWKEPSGASERVYLKFEDKRLTSGRHQMIVVNRPGVSQAYLRMAFPAPLLQSGSYYALAVANALTGEYFNSRLNSLVRDKAGLTYSIESGMSFSMGFSEFSIHTSASNENIGLLAQKCQDVLEGFKKNPVTQDEMDQAKTFILGQFPVTASSIQAVASKWLGGYLMGRDAQHLNQFSDGIRAVTLADVQTVTQQVFDTRQMVVVAAGDSKAIEAGMKKPGAIRLKIKPVSMKDLR